MYHQRDRFGAMKRPGLAYANFRYLRESGFFHPDHAWKDANAAHRKKLRKKKIARLSRRANRVG